MLNFLSKIFIFALSVIHFFLIIVILLTILGFLAPYISNIESYPYVYQIIGFEAKINHFIKSYIPTKIFGFNLSRILFIIALILLINIIQTSISKLKYRTRKRRVTPEVKKMNPLSDTSQINREKSDLLKDKMEQINAASAENRQVLLKEFVALKKKLERIGRDLAFLAIDVVDSCGMKEGEDPESIEHDFIEYRKFVEAKCKEHGYIKAAWTPDGVMICFNTIENALQTAKAIIEGLDYFNHHVKVMKVDFQIRCGVNGGFIYYDDSIPLEQISDRIIDIAGHMQKHAHPNTILIAKQIIEPVRSNSHFLPTKKLVDGLEVCEWNITDDK